MPMANTKNGQDRGPLPPYIPFKTLQGFVQKLKETTVPPRIDGSLLRSYSGSVARQLVASLRYLKLIDDASQTADKLRDLVKAQGTPEFPEMMSRVITEGYIDVIGDLDTDNATYGSLAEKFKAKGAEGQVLQKCIAFYINGLKASNMTFSPHFTERAPRARRGAGTPRNPKRDPPVDDFSDTPVPPTQSGTVKFSFPVPEKGTANIFVPSTLTGEDWEMISGMMQLYIARLAKNAKAS
jgi:hypothetical protein